MKPSLKPVASFSVKYRVFDSWSSLIATIRVNVPSKCPQDAPGDSFAELLGKQKATTFSDTRGRVNDGETDEEKFKDRGRESVCERVKRERENKVCCNKSLESWIRGHREHISQRSQSESETHSQSRHVCVCVCVCCMTESKKFSGCHLGKSRMFWQLYWEEQSFFSCRFLRRASL